MAHYDTVDPARYILKLVVYAGFSAGNLPSVAVAAPVQEQRADWWPRRLENF